MWDPYAEFESAVLPNGLTVYVAHWPSRPWETAGFVIHSGANEDPQGLEGLAHFVEHLVFENGASSHMEVQGFFEDVGGGAGLGCTGYLETSYSFFSPKDPKIFSQALGLFGKALLLARINSQVEKQREIILREFDQKFPFRFLLEEAKKTRGILHKGNILERSLRPLGGPDSIRRITQADLQSFHGNHYTPANMSVVCVGGLSLEEVIEHLEESPFGLQKDGRRIEPVTPLGHFDPLDENRLVIEMREQGALGMSTGWYRNRTKIPGSIGFEVLRVLGGMFQEVIRDEIREKRKWSYSAGSTFSSYRQFYEFEVGAKALEPVALDGVEEVFQDIIESMSERLELFERKRAKLVAALEMKDITGQSLRNGAMNDLETVGRIVSLEEVRQELLLVSMDDVREALRWLSPEYQWNVLLKP